MHIFIREEGAQRTFWYKCPRKLTDQLKKFIGWYDLSPLLNVNKLHVFWYCTKETAHCRLENIRLSCIQFNSMFRTRCRFVSKYVDGAMWPWEEEMNLTNFTVANSNRIFPNQMQEWHSWFVIWNEFFSLGAPEIEFNNCSCSPKKAVCIRELFTDKFTANQERIWLVDYV